MIDGVIAGAASCNTLISSNPTSLQWTTSGDERQKSLRWTTSGTQATIEGWDFATDSHWWTTGGPPQANNVASGSPAISWTSVWLATTGNQWLSVVGPPLRCYLGVCMLKICMEHHRHRKSREASCVCVGLQLICERSEQRSPLGICPDRLKHI